MLRCEVGRVSLLENRFVFKGFVGGVGYICGCGCGCGCV